LPPLTKAQNVKVLDVGCAKSLFIYELAHRGYETWGIDINGYQEKVPKDIKIYKGNIINFKMTNEADFITCISVLEHLPIKPNYSEHERVLYWILRNLKIGGRILLTIPTQEYAQRHPWLGYTHKILKDILCGMGGVAGIIIEQTERAGQLCVVIERAA